MTEERRVMPEAMRYVWPAVAFIAVLAPLMFSPYVALIVAAPAAVAVAVALLRWPIGRVSLAVAATVTTVLSLLVDLFYVGPVEVAAFWMYCEAAALWVIVGRMGRQSPIARLWVWVLLGLATSMLPLRYTMRMSTTGWAPTIILVPVMVVPTLCALIIGLYLRTLDKQRIHAVAQARRDQRLQVAGDLHDFVAHEVTGIVLEAQAAKVADYDHHQMRALVSRIEAAGLRALETMDRTVQALRDPDQTGSDAVAATREYDLRDLLDLITRFGANGAVHTSLELADGLTDRMDAQTQATAYLVVIEALTNVRRHAPGAANVSVTVVPAGNHMVEVSVVDDGGGTDRHDTGRASGGTGLIGLNERVRALGGAFTAGPCADGWLVCCLLPAGLPRRRS